MDDDESNLSPLEEREGVPDRRVGPMDDFVDDLVKRKSEELRPLRVAEGLNSFPDKNIYRVDGLHDQNTSWKKKVIVSPEVKSAVVKEGEGGRVLQGHHSWAKRIHSKMQEYQAMFGLGEDEELLDSFMCALRKKILLQGRLYVFSRHVCFSSSLFGYHKIKSIPVSSIMSLQKMKNVGFPNSLEIVWRDGDSVKKEFFTSFLSREEAFKLILSLWEVSFVKHSDEKAPCVDDRSSGESSMSDVIPHHHKPDDSLNALQAHEMLQLSQSGNHHNGEILTPREGGDSINENSFGRTMCAQPAPPVPAVMQKVMEYSLPVHPKEFYDTFLSSKSDFFIEFHNAQGHKNIELTPWDEHSSIGPVRDLSFVTALKGFRIGPSEALCHQTQRVGVYEGSHTVFETSQVMSDIPYGDHFKVETRWDICPDTTGSGSTLVIHIAVPFTKNTMWKKFIEKGVTESLLEAYQMFRRLADQAIARIGESGGSLKPEDLLPQQEEDWEMILGRVEPKFREGLSSLRKMQQDLAQQNKFSLAKPQHRRNTSIIDSDFLDAIVPPEEEEGGEKTPAKDVAEKSSLENTPCQSCLQTVHSEKRMRILLVLVIVLAVIVLVQSVVMWHVLSKTTQ